MRLEDGLLTEMTDDEVINNFIRSKENNLICEMRRQIDTLKSKNTFLMVISYFLFILCILETLGLFGILK